ncbi:hypothetical protein ABZ686_02350 [Streptomyces sp. NPDC006992]|uniref:hypothetical protein n=1 Tax=Streptomyces sp. NPDC006992 TaxID=3155601 RepID=UPI0033DF40B6
MKISRILARARGRTPAYETPAGVENALRDQFERVEKRLPAHMYGAAQLEGVLAYQPGLVDLAGEAYDTVLYLEALLTAARSRGHTGLADSLQDAALAYREAAAVLSQAAYSTAPKPPLREAR